MHIDEHASELGRWRSAQRNAHPRLRAYVRGYFASSSSLPKAIRERHLPSAEIPLFLNFGAPHRRLDPAAPHNGLARDGVWIVGLHDRHQLSEAAGERDFMIVRFTPPGAHLFLRTPMHAIAGQAVELCALDPKLADMVMSRVGVAQSWSERFDAMEVLIAERVAQAAAPGGVAWAWHRLEAAGGRVAMGPLAAELGCSHRAFIAGFRTCIGVTPKAAARLLRFNRAARSLDEFLRNGNGEPAGKPYIETPPKKASPGFVVPWAELAADCGYFDQSHFINEFRQFGGTTPTEFLRTASDVA